MLRAVGGAKDTVDLRERLHRLIEESKLLSVDTKELIKDLGNIANGGYQGGGSGNQRQRLEARKLSDEFTKSLQRFQEVVRSTLSKERESIAKVSIDPRTNQRTHARMSPQRHSRSILTLFRQAKRSTSHGAAQGEEDEQERLLHRDRDIEFMQVENDLNFSEALIVEREQGIKEIEKSVHDVNDIFRCGSATGARRPCSHHPGILTMSICGMSFLVLFCGIFRDLAVLIGDQGGMLDDIEAGVMNTAEHTETAKRSEISPHAPAPRSHRECRVGWCFCSLPALELAEG